MMLISVESNPRDKRNDSPIFYYVEDWKSGHTNYAVADREGNFANFKRTGDLAEEIKRQRSGLNFQGLNPILRNDVPPGLERMGKVLTRRPLDMDEYVGLHRALGNTIELRFVE